MRHLLTLLALGLAIGACDESQDPSATGPEFFTATGDGAPWASPARIVAVLIGPSPATAGLDIAATALTPTGFLRLELYLRQPPTLGTVALADTAAPGSGIYLVADTASGAPQRGLTIYSTQPGWPGLLRLTGHEPADSTVAGTYTFSASPTQDPTRHVTISGSFRVRYTFIQVAAPAYH